MNRLYWPLACLLVLSAACDKLPNTDQAPYNLVQHDPEPSTDPAPSPDPLPPVPPVPPGTRLLEVFNCKIDEFKITGHAPSEHDVEIIHRPGSLIIKPGDGQGGEYHVQIYASKLRAISLAGSFTVRIIDLCGDTLSIQSAGSSDIEFSGELRRLDIDVAGSSSVLMRGQAERLNVSVAGSSDVSARDLTARDVNVDNAGSADVEVCATSSLRVDIAGSSQVDYYCDPTDVSHQVAGSGGITRR